MESKNVSYRRAGTIAEAVRIGGDHWGLYLKPGTLDDACRLNSMQASRDHLVDGLAMHMRIKYRRKY